jgi:LmbE family N-acetylglucosaminyl deacetylase
MASPIRRAARAPDPLERLCGRGPPPRTVVVCAHPDDEIVGAGARLRALRDVAVVHVTDGAPADMRDAAALGLPTRGAYAGARRAERRRALALAGVGDDRVHDAGLVDQDASLRMAELALRLAVRLDALGPEVVVTHPYEGGHPDHDATAFAVHAAVRRLAGARRAARPPPAIVEMTSYPARGDRLATGEFLPHPGAETRTVELDAHERALKRRMLDCHASQRRTLRAFGVEHERFRLAPAYDFARPPHAGRLWYEWFGWGGMTGERWRALAADAAESLRAARHTVRHAARRTA